MSNNIREFKTTKQLNNNAIIFDLDGTLWNTIDSCLKSISDVKKEHKEITKEITENEVISSMGLPFDDIVKIYYGYLNKDKAIQYAKEAFDRNVKNLMTNGGILYENTTDIIKELSEDYSLYIVSNCIEGYIESFLETSNLKKYFKDFESNGRTKKSKGENIKLIIDRNNIKKAIYVGDTISDMKAADYANIPFVQARYGFGNNLETNYYINTIEELPKIAKKVLLGE